MKIEENFPLAKNTTMALGGNAKFVSIAETKDDVKDICDYAEAEGLKLFVLGGGSNSIARDEGFDGLILKNQISGLEITDDNPESTAFRVGAGEDWDKFVELTVERELSGLEGLSAIPGTVGAAPVQNVGAYGYEVADTIQSVEAYDRQDKQFVSLQNDDCKFGYRSSIFRESEKGRFVITHVIFKLAKTAPKPPFYAAVEKYFSEHGVTDYTPQAIRRAVTDIRADKLPDPKLVANSGSFFKNSIVSADFRDDLLERYGDMPNYQMPDGSYKIPTGWLIEQTGLKGQVLGRMKVHDKNALVLTNQSAESYIELAQARQQIIEAVRQKFGITIEQEPLEIC